MKSPAGEGKPGFGYVLSTCTLTQAGLAWCLFIFPPIAVEVASDLDLDPIYVGYQVGIVFFTTIAATLYSGELIEKIGPVRALQLALFVALAGLVLCATETLVGMAIGSSFFGLSHSVVNPSTAMILRNRVNPRNRGFVFSIKQTSVPIGLMASSFFGPFLVEGYDWRISMLPLAICLFMLMAMNQPLHEGKVRPSPKANEGFLLIPYRSIMAFVNNKSLLLMATAGLAYGMCQGTMMTFTSNMFADELGYTLRIAGIVLMSMQLGGIFGRLFWGYLADTLQNPVLVLRLIAVLIILASLAVAILPASTPIGIWIALFLFIGFSAVGWNGLIVSEYAELSRGAEMERQMAGAFFLMFFGGAISPVLFPHVYALFGSYSTTMGVFCTAFGLMALVFVRNAPEVPEHHHPPTPMEQEA